VSRYYETLFIIRPSADDATVDAAMATTKQHIQAAGGEILREQNWGKRKLAYEVGGFAEGIYAQLNFTAPANYPKTLEQMFRLHEDVIRDIVIRTEGPPPEEYPEYLHQQEEPRRYRDDDRGRDDDRPRRRDDDRDRDSDDDDDDSDD